MEQLKLFSEQKKSQDLNTAPQNKVFKDGKKPTKGFSNKEEYYKSEEWETKRLFALRRAQHRCDKCGSKGPLQVHHLTYDRIYNERPEDLEVLCNKCHEKADREREYDNWYNSAFETYMTKKYGGDWDYFDGCKEEFDTWLESRRDD